MKTVLLFLILFTAIAQPLCAQPGTDNTLKTDVAVLKADVKNLKETVNNGFNAIEKNFDRQNNIIIACIGLPLAILAIGATIWGILAHRCALKDSAREKEIEILKQEIETLKQRYAIVP